MALLCHNNHYGDGWEHEGDDTRYFDRFSEPMGYPMLLNILVYTMSHWKRRARLAMRSAEGSGLKECPS